MGRHLYIFVSLFTILFKHLDLFVGAEIRGGEKLTEVFPVLTHGSRGRSSSGFFLVASSFAPAASLSQWPLLWFLEAGSHTIEQAEGS